MGYIKAEYGKNNMFELDIEVKDCNPIECLSFASGVADRVATDWAVLDEARPWQDEKWL